MIRALLATTLLLLLTACATTPSPIAQGPFTPVSLKQALSMKRWEAACAGEE